MPMCKIDLVRSGRRIVFACPENVMLMKFQQMTAECRQFELLEMREGIPPP